MKSIFEEVFATIEKRKTEINDKEKSKNSYVISLLLAGDQKILDKIKEECAEIVEAIDKNESKDRVIHETCDLLFHLFVLCAKKDITLQHLQRELEKRHGISGLEEKRNRKIEGKNAPSR